MVLPDPLRRRFRDQIAGQPSVEVVLAFGHQRFHLVGEEVVCAGDGLVGDEDALLGLQLFDQTVDVLFGATRSASPETIRPEDGQGARKEKS